MSTVQHRITRFLELELHHSLGAYRHATEGLRDLATMIEDDVGGASPDSMTVSRNLRELVRTNCTFNEQLDEWRNQSEPECRHPRTPVLPLSGGEGLDPPPRTDGVAAVGAFYNVALSVLSEQQINHHADSPLGTAFMLTRRSLTGLSSDADRPFVTAASRARRIARNERRLAFAVQSGIRAREGADDDRATILESDLEEWTARTDPEAPRLGVHVLQALVEGHLLMHAVQHERSKKLAERSTWALDAERKSQTDAALDRSIALNTFVWTVSRTAPWVFAEHARERDYMAVEQQRAWRTHMPMRVMWIASQTSLLALFRRAYAHVLAGRSADAYKDFLKLHATVRDTARRLESASARTAGSLEFLEALEAMADYHVGDLYRTEGDHLSALSHLGRSRHRLEALRQQEAGDVLLKNSRWLVQLYLGLGKASYELGRHKVSLAYFLRAWRALVDVITHDTKGDQNAVAVSRAIAWLDDVQFDPELHKRDVVRYITPVVEQLSDYHVDSHYTEVAADIVARLGHLLFVLNLSERRYPAQTRLAGPEDDRHFDGELALRCFRKAHALDPQSTLVLSDLLKLVFRMSRVPKEHDPKARERLEELLEFDFPQIEDHWPGGSSDTDRFSRAIEYVLLRQLADTVRDEQPVVTSDAMNERERRRAAARELLHGLLVHTDSVSARKTQAHDFLMRPRSEAQPPDAETGPTIEFVCLRRYSSTFPVLPRPRGFRSYGGGYFIRLHAPNAVAPLGLAIDPGTGFIDCLYRAGFSISDVDAVIVTHDHVDHASSLEPLLALLYEANQLVPKNERRDVPVFGNKSLAHRVTAYRRKLIRLDYRPAVAQAKLRELARCLAPPGGAPPEIEFIPLSSRLREGKDGAHKDMMDNPSVGFLLKIADPASPVKRSIAITSDLPNIAPDENWSTEWHKAFAADTMVAHVSTVPLPEIRKLAELDELGVARDAAWINETLPKIPALSQRVNYGHWLEYDNGAAPPVAGGRDLEAWTLPPHHPYLDGLFNLATRFRNAPNRHETSRLFVVGELSEELGSFRGKIAWQLNQTVLTGSSRALSADIDLRVVMTATARAPEHLGVDAVRVLCSTCTQDNDLAPVERYHEPHAIREVCVKGENEGLFYYCADHEPSAAPSHPDPVFFERHERFDVFGR